MTSAKITRVSEELARAKSWLKIFADLPVIPLGSVPGTDCEIIAIDGGAHQGQSFKDLLGLGLLVLAREQELLAHGQRVIESSSGSTLVGLARAGLILDHPVQIVTDPNVPKLTRRKGELLGANIVEVDKPHPELGWQQAREDRVREELARAPDLYWTDQNNNANNPRVYQRWLLPALERKLDPRDVAASVFVVGSGGHFSALSAWLKSWSLGVATYAADRPGSITFGGATGPSWVRGVGNSNTVPAVLAAHRDLVDDVVVIDDGEAFRCCRELAARGLFVGGSSGLAFAAARRIALKRKHGVILTMLPDRGDLYAETIWNDGWMERHGFLTA